VEFKQNPPWSLNKTYRGIKAKPTVEFMQNPPWNSCKTHRGIHAKPTVEFMQNPPWNLNKTHRGTETGFFLKKNHFLYCFLQIAPYTFRYRRKECKFRVVGGR